MNRLISGMVASFAVLVLGSCSTDPTDDLRDGVDKLVASPGQLFLEPGGSAQVEVGAVDAQGNQLSFPYTVTTVGPGITVRRDSTFLPIFVNDTLLTVPETAPRMRFVVTANPFTGAGSFPVTSFTIAGGGDSVVVPVQVAPLGDFEATFSTLTPALGDTITITTAAGAKFTPTTTVTFPGPGLEPVIVDRSADSTSIRFLTPPNLGGAIQLTNVVTASAPGVLLAPTTTQSLSPIVIDSVDAVFSNVTPAIGETVTLTLPALIKFRAAVVGPPAVPQTALSFPNQVAAPAAVTIAPDSSSLTFQAPPNALGPAVMDTLIFPGGYKLGFPTRQHIDAGDIGTTVAVTFSNPTPALGEIITATAPANFSFSPTTTLTFGTKLGAIQSIAPGGGSLTFLPLPGTTGPATITGLVYTPAPQFSVTLPTDGTVANQTVTTADIIPLPNADHPSTAPALTVPAPGGTTTLFDAGPYNGPGDCCFGGHERLYRLEITEAMTLTFTVDWWEGQDLGVYILQSDAVTLINAGDSFGGGPTGHPETVTVPFTPGTYFVAIPNFSATNPNLFKLTIDR